jgi:lipid II:glycine glycyltransferase (peptidoglycan interpeptide bridge formation enzyme)
MRLLADRLPGAITAVLARHASEPVAGVVLFESPRVSHAQYIASSAAGNAVGALDAVFDHCFARAAARGARYLDFGTSNREGGRVLNEGLYGFKAQFGGGGVAYERYELDLSGTSNSS